ncbi:DUF397 domain-containing protein [Planomonospora venezuelensis]|uniref:ABC-type amino acid transport substrate-binding protein n=1 Tax=Planomonospora venezuelensis TaxID=1999 RepID=A0A841DAA8_PLAVE|nr:DUF397 domain-containing protein [Planomonospora venezuelensis]MBB5965404.1 ABC-type amino acid transport substrate-binding protein [Planomonospora venezuelensis]GIM62742.1 hypothetical protein Pve01_78490 [Planomonospora venezuelensis]
MNDLSRELAEAAWRKSSRSSSNGGDCVEVAQLSGGRRGVRDSKNPNGPKLVFTPSEWDAFLNGVKAGEFD